MIVAFATLLIVWGNAVNHFVQPVLPGGSASAIAWGAALAAVTLLFARARGLGAADLGLAPIRARPTIVGALLGAAVAAAGVLVLRFPPLLAAPVAYAPLAAVDDATLAIHVLFFLPLAVAVPEELAFRGALLGALRARRGTRAAVAWSALAFSLWHALLVYVTLQQTNIAGTAIVWLAGGLAMIAVLAGGVALAALRLRGGLTASAAAHWAFDALILAGLRP